MKRILSITLVLSMLFALCPLGALDAFAKTYSGTCGTNVTWSLDTETGTLTISGEGDMDNYTYYSNAPWYRYRGSVTTALINEGVTSIGYYAFYECTSLTSVTIGDSVSAIGEYAFRGCTRLISVTIPDSVTSIDSYAFSGCESLTNVSIPDSVTTIHSSAFSGCESLTGIDIPDSVTTIDSYAFSGCESLTGIDIPYSVTSIAGSSFARCNSLNTITVDKHNSVYKSVGNCIIKKETGILVLGCKYSTIPNDGSVTAIGAQAFLNCTSLKSITIPDSVTRIYNHAFAYCTSLTNVSIPDSVTSIGYSTFYECASLTSVTIGDSVSSIGESAFCGCTSLTSVTIGDSVSSIDYHAFCDCTSLKSITIPDGVTSIGAQAFWNCTSLKSITIPDSVTSIDNHAFYKCTSLYTVIYNGIESDWTCINIGGGNEPLLNARIMFNDGTWKASSSDHTVKVVNSSGNPIGNAKVEVIQSGSTEYYFTTKNGYVIFQKDSDSELDFIITADGYYEETTVGKDFEISNSGVDIFTLYTPDEAGLRLTQAIYQDTDSAYNDVLEFDVNLLKGGKRLSMANVGAGYFRILCSTSDTSQVEKYTLYQDGKIIAVSKNGVFNLRIANFSVGRNIYVTVFGKNGKKVTTHLNLGICEDSPVADGSISFGEELSFSVPSSVPFVGGDKVTCDIPDLPIDFELEDGKLYAGLNVNFTEDKSIKEQYEELKTTMNDVKKLSSYKVGKNLKGNITKFLKKRDKFNLLVAGKVEAMFFGGGEVTWSENGLDGMKIQAYFLVDASLEKNWQTAVSVVPVTIRIKVGVEGKLQATLDWNFEAETLNGDVTLNLKPYLNAFGGAGVGKYIGVGVYGDADVDLEIQLIGTTVSPGLNSAGLTGELGLKAYAGPFTYKKSFAHNTWYLFSRTGAVNYASTSVNSYYADLYDSKNYAIQDVSYLKDQSEWLGDWVSVSKYLSNGATAENIKIKPLLEGTYRNLQPALAVNGDTTVMVYLGADTSRQAQNISVVMYSVYNAETNTWSKPLKVDNNLTADAVPMLYSDGKTIRLVYQDASKVYNASFGESEYLTTQNIVVYVYDETTDSFVLEQTFEADNAQYRTPKMTAVNGVPTIVWISSENSDILGQSDDNSLMYSCFDSSWSEPQILADGICTIPDYAVGSLDGELSVLYTADTDNDLATDADRTLMLLDENENTTVSEGVASNLDFVKLPSESNETFVWVVDDALNTLGDYNEIKNVCYVGSHESISVVGDKILFTLGTTTENGESNSEIFVVVYDKTTEEYGNAIQVSTQDKYIENISAVEFNGSELVVMTRKQVEITENDVIDDCELSWAVLKDGSDLKIDNVEYSYSDVQDNALPMHISVTNKGSVAINRYVVSVIDDMGNMVVSVICEESLSAGEIKDITIELPLENIRYLTQYSIVAGESIDDVNDEYVFTVGYADLKIQTEAIRIGTQNTLVCTVTNQGRSSADGKLVVYDGSEQNLVSVGTFEDLAPGERCTFVFDLAGMEGEQVLTCVVKTDAEEYVESNNTETVYFDFSSLKEAECQHILDQCVCIGCGETIHTYDDKCDADCNVCGEECIPAHYYGSVVTTPTCTEDGFTTYTCSGCGDSYVDDEIGAPGHTEGIWETLPNGSKELRCAVCGDLLDSETVPEYAVGDVNGDNKINMFDYMILKSYYFEIITFDEAEFARADITGDGKVNMFDYMKLKLIVFAQ